jgi:diguanylate cyclase (GGDEF)-like protein/PAS domain S-box-containing protein
MDNHLQYIAGGSVILWELDEDDRFIFFDHDSAWPLRDGAGATLAGWTAGIHPDDTAQVAQLRSQARQADRRFQLEYRVVDKDGQYRHVRETAAPRPRPGCAAGYAGVFSDISEQVQSRARLAWGDAEHRLLTQNVRDLIAYSDVDNIYQYVSPSHQEILGYRPQEMVGTNVFDYLHPADLAAMHAARGDGPDDRSAMYNMRVRHKDGSWVWMGINSRTLRDAASGRRTGFVAVGRDITAQLEAQRELARREQQFRSLTSLSSDWYWETDANGCFSFLSDGIQSRLGVAPRQLLGTSMEACALDTSEPGFLACKSSVAARRPFRDAVYSVGLEGYPGVVRYIRISGEPIFEEGQFQGYRGATRDVTREVRNAKTLEHMATHDSLTGLCNRALLETRLRQRAQDRRANGMHAILFIDLDRFKQVNDTLGHKAGDLLLAEIARRLKHCVRPDDTVARLGGDEFVILADCGQDIAAASAIAGKLLVALNAPFVLGSHSIRPSASIGISICPQDGVNPERLLQDADCALYRAKRDGRECFRFYHPEMRSAAPPGRQAAH